MGNTNQGCRALGPRFVGDPVDVVTGEVTDIGRDFAVVCGGVDFRWERHYRSHAAQQDRGNGFGHRHCLDWELRRHLDGWTLEGPQVEVDFTRIDNDGDSVRAMGWTLTRRSATVYRAGKVGQPTRVFALHRVGARIGRLERLIHDDGLESVLGYEGPHDSPRLVTLQSRGWGLRLAWKSDRIATIRGTGMVHGTTFVRYEYDEVGQLVRATDAYNQVFTWAYDQPGRVARRADRRGYGFVYSYDRADRCIRVAGDDGVDATLLRFDPVNHQTVVEHESNGAVWVYRYASNHDLTEIEFPNGGTRSFLYDANTGALESETDCMGGTWRSVRDGAGRVVGKTDPLGFRHPPNEDPTDPEFSPLHHRVPGSVAGQELGGLVVLGFEVPKAVSLGAGQDSDLRSVLIAGEYVGVEQEVRDVQGLPLRDERIFANGSKQTRRYAYDPNGNVAKVQGYKGGTWSYEFASWNQCVASKDPLGNHRRFAYSRRDKVKRVEDGCGTVTEYEWDLLDQLAMVQRVGGACERYERDAGGQVVAKYDGQGNELVVYENGPMGALMARRTPDGVEDQFKRDAHGNILAIETCGQDGRGCTSEFAYDGSGRRTLDLRDGDGITHRFSGANLLQSALKFSSQADGNTFVTDYDHPDPNTVRICDPSGAVHVIERKESGIVKRTFANGTVELQQYDGKGAGLSKASRGASGLWRRRFLLDSDRDLQKREDDRRGITQYQYDAARRLVRVTQPDGQHQAFEHDAAGNLLGKPGLAEGQMDGDRGPSPLVSFGAIAAKAPGNRLHRANGDRIHYDELDHICAREGIGGRTNYVRDGLGRLTRIEQVPPGPTTTRLVWEAEYDGLGRRIAKRVHVEDRVEEWRFYWDTDRLAAEIFPDGRLRVYVYVDAAALVPLLAVEYASVNADAASGKRFVFQTDHRGAVERVEDERGEIVWDATVHPYGDVTVHVDTGFHQPLRLVGQYFDVETGLCSQRFRYWSPELGRFLERDPQGLAGWNNEYAWPGCPLNASDPLGLNCPQCKQAKSDCDCEETGPREQTPENPLYRKDARDWEKIEAHEGFRPQPATTENLDNYQNFVTTGESDGYSVSTTTDPKKAAEGEFNAAGAEFVYVIDRDHDAMNDRVFIDADAELGGANIHSESEVSVRGPGTQEAFDQGRDLSDQPAVPLEAVEGRYRVEDGKLVDYESRPDPTLDTPAAQSDYDRAMAKWLKDNEDADLPPVIDVQD